jgi:hypothetical protein
MLDQNPEVQHPVKNVLIYIYIHNIYIIYVYT